jgi:hypothetical protein
MDEGGRKGRIISTSCILNGGDVGNLGSGKRENRSFFAVFGFILLLGLVLLALSSLQRTAPALVHPPSVSSTGEALGGLARTPPMGWNSWNKFQCNVSDVLIRQIADAMVSSGMRDAGYGYIIIDDCWMSPRREKGHLMPDPTTFPYGIKPLADYIHSKGLKFGLYSDRGNPYVPGPGIIPRA